MQPAGGAIMATLLSLYYKNCVGSVIQSHILCSAEVEQICAGKQAVDGKDLIMHATVLCQTNQVIYLHTNDKYTQVTIEGLFLKLNTIH